MAFLSLPGELRNKIYDEALFPNHEYLVIINCSQPRDIVCSVLSSPVFRISRRIRAEALARLCSTKRIEILDVSSANTFLDYISSTGQDNITNIVIGLKNVEQMASSHADIFFANLAKLKALKSLKMEVGSSVLKLPIRDVQPTGDLPDWDFFAKMEKFAKTRGDVEVSWATWATGMDWPWLMFMAQRRRLERMFGKEKRESGVQGLVGRRFG
ncbi:hypothetical protein BU26DRAFT_524221 [Trematosphaeria pertusa]|uniref:F-box domain-containing protein n=1 Tax=Trematosphaeria pertusa TaxID=390896 RepID=A0A6A6HX32_9PLEO|nr:uncharacterized protein BU26DRAFT_524221 [Trematosphaeria pertusa]KAF2242636.1 hypothetical protein BU26DRAFT_524221 [Trematosphaeria pertusa]